MNKIEFIKTLRIFGLNEAFSKTKAKTREMEEVFLWKGLLINFSGTSYAIVRGKVPYEVAQRIYNKYPLNEYGIRIDGGYINSKPSEYVTDDQYKKEIDNHINEHLDSEDFLSKCEQSKNELLKRSNDEKYIDLYHIDTFEGLIVLMTEMIDYYNRKNNRNEEETSKVDNYIKLIYQEILDYIQPNISIYEWMSTDPEVSEDFNQIVNLNYQTTLGREFRRVLDEFDAAINPYTNHTLKEIELVDINNYLEKIDISITPFNQKDGEFREHCCSLNIQDKNTKNTTRHFRNPHGFSNVGTFRISEDHTLLVVHCYNQSGENISIGHYGKGCKNEMDISYNISLGTVTIDGDLPRCITPHEFGIIYDEIVKATELARSVTIENMKKQDYGRTLK